MATTAAKQARATKRGRQRQDSLRNYWLREGAPKLAFGDDEWRVRCFRGQGRPVLDLSDLTTQVGWTDNGPILTGAMTLRQPDNHARLDISEGHVIHLDWRHAGARAWRQVWEMRLGGPLENTGVSTSVKAGTSEFQLADDLTLLARGKVSFKCKSKLVHQALSIFCRENGIPHGPLPKTRHRIKSFHMTDSPLNIIMALIRAENVNEDRFFRIRWVPESGVNFVPLQRSRYLVEIGDTVLDATLLQRRRVDFTTELTAKATTGSKRHKRHITTTVTSTAYQRRFGTVRRTINVDADSVSEARIKAKRVLAKLLLPHREVTFTHPGIPFLRRQAALKLRIASQGFDRLVYVSSIAHTVTSSNYTMDVAVQFTDPFAETAAQKKAAKCAAAKARGRRSKDCDGRTHRTTKKKSKKQKQRTDSTTVATPPRRTPGQRLSDRGAT
jgi:hypothetical protein